MDDYIPREWTVDFRILCPILPQLMSKYRAAPRFTLVLGPQSTATGDIPRANPPDAVPTTDDSPERTRRGGRLADLEWCSRKNDRMPRYGTSSTAHGRSRARLHVP